MPAPSDVLGPRFQATYLPTGFKFYDEYNLPISHTDSTAVAHMVEYANFSKAEALAAGPNVDLQTILIGASTQPGPAADEASAIGGERIQIRNGLDAVLSDVTNDSAPTLHRIMWQERPGIWLQVSSDLGTSDELIEIVNSLVEG